MDWFTEFLKDNAGTIGSVIVAAVVIIIAIAWVDRHPSKKQPGHHHNEPRRDDE